MRTVDPIEKYVKSREGGSDDRPAVIGKTEVAVFAQDDVIQEGDPKELSAFAQPLCEDPILLARGRVTGRVVMRTDTRSRIHQD